MDYTNLSVEEIQKEAAKAEELNKLISGRATLLTKIAGAKMSDQGTLKVSDAIITLSEKEMQALINYWLSFVEKYDKKIASLTTNE